jgi:hypothetical protein
VKLEKLLLQHKAAILKKWFERILETYPPDSQKFLKSQKNPFANPLGSTLSRGIEEIYDQIIDDRMDEAVLSPSLDRIVRIRAVQDFTPREAMGFMFLLKDVVRGELKKEVQEIGLFAELAVFESRIDDAALLAFGIYMHCREQIYRIAADELRNRSVNLVERLNRFYKKRGEKLDLEDANDDPIL